MDKNQFENQDWREKMRISLDFNNVMSDFISDSQGISLSELEDFSDNINQAVINLDNKRKNNQVTWRDLPYNQPVDEILDYANKTEDQIENFVLFGIGGSALGPLALHQAINHLYYNELPHDRRKHPKFFVADNIDPERLACLFDVIDISKSLFNIVSKSGNTSETMSQFMIIKDMLEKKLGKQEAKDHIVCTTDKEYGSLVKVAHAENYKTFYMPRRVGGRFSVLSPVGLLPAAFCGINIKELLAGAAFMDEIIKSDPEKNIAVMFAVINYLSMKHNKNISVMMPYADSLKYISDWYAQLWAESLGKAVDNNNQIINAGQTPVKALGVTDQHSQVQLYNEGPYDKIITFLTVEEYRKEIFVPKIFSDIPELGFLGGTSHNQLIQAEQKATEFALTKQNRINMTISLPQVNEFALGQLFYMLEVATAFAGEFLNIDAFNQPGVEEAKNATYAIFNKPGYESKKRELENTPQKNKKYFA